jgi:hypothetical protein
VRQFQFASVATRCGLMHPGENNPSSPGVKIATPAEKKRKPSSIPTLRLSMPQMTAFRGLALRQTPTPLRPNRFPGGTWNTFREITKGKLVLRKWPDRPARQPNQEEKPLSSQPHRSRFPSHKLTSPRVSWLAAEDSFVGAFLHVSTGSNPI